MPPIGPIAGTLVISIPYHDHSANTYTSFAKAQKAFAPIILYGPFIRTLIEVLIGSFFSLMILLAVRLANHFQHHQATAAPTSREDPSCRSYVRLKLTFCGNFTSEVKTAYKSKTSNRGKRGWEISPFFVVHALLLPAYLMR